LAGKDVDGKRKYMKKRVLTLTTCAYILVCGVAGANAEEGMGDRSHDGRGMMGHSSRMGCGMMGRGGMMGSGGMMDRGAAMRFIFALMDSDGDGTVSLQEFQSAHEKIFKAIDTDKDGTISLEEIRAFMRGPGKSTPKEHHEDEHELE
jgi:hypothetical protein